MRRAFSARCPAGHSQLSTSSVRRCAGGRRPAECAARAAIAFVACDEVGVAGERIAELVGVSAAAVSMACRRDREHPGLREWRIDDVLTWCVAGR